ncbi:MAG: helix-turn-helix transcriptional regulator [Oscillospiraceae bacterium]
MHKEPETLGEILKTAGMRADITMETLAERVDITERYLYRIENEGKKPSFDVLYKLIGNLQYQRIRFSIPKSRPKIPK